MGSRTVAAGCCAARDVFAAAANNVVVGDGGAGLLHRGFERQFGACESVSGLQLVDSFQQEIFDIDILHAFIVSPW